MRLHILGICGTFMGGLAVLAREMGHEVSGSDTHVYPPMSSLLRDSGIEVHEGYTIEPLQQGHDMVIIGNALSRGNPTVEYVLDQHLPYTSGPQWLADNLLRGRHVIAVSGTHGKTTSTSMLAWVLECAGRNPGFLIGGVAENFGVSARLGGGDYFVVEADEYDTAFFDKRSKFIHYQPRTLIINNIEYDHADIFSDIGDIIREFRRLLRIVPGAGCIVLKAGDPHIATVLEGGCWTPTTSFGQGAGDWQINALRADWSGFEISYQGQSMAKVSWGLIGAHNAENALAVTAAAYQLGIPPEQTAASLAGFTSVKRRLQKIAEINAVNLYDDFAHHPTAISTTLAALRAKVGEQRIIAVFEPRSNTMKMGIHQHSLGQAFNTADELWVFRPEGINWDMEGAFRQMAGRYHIDMDIDTMVDNLADHIREGDNIVIMSNGGFGGIQEKLILRLQSGR